MSTIQTPEKLAKQIYQTCQAYSEEQAIERIAHALRPVEASLLRVTGFWGNPLRVVLSDGRAAAITPKLAIAVAAHEASPLLGDEEVAREIAIYETRHGGLVKYENALPWEDRLKHMTDVIARHREQATAPLLTAGNALRAIVEGIQNLNHGTWRDEKGMRLKDTPEWVAFYNSLPSAAAHPTKAESLEVDIG